MTETKITTQLTSPSPYCLIDTKGKRCDIHPACIIFDEVHVKQVSGPPITSWMNDYIVLFPRNEEGKVDVKRGVYDTNNQPKRSSFTYEQERQFYLVVAKVESQDWTITGKSCLVFDYTGKCFSR